MIEALLHTGGGGGGRFETFGHKNAIKQRDWFYGNPKDFLKTPKTLPLLDFQLP